MGRPTKLSKALPRIERFFKKNKETEIYTYDQLRVVLKEHREQWDLPNAFHIDSFIRALQEGKVGLKKTTFLFYPVHITRYVLGTIEYSDALKIAASLNKKAYLSHYTALYLHGLTEQLPKNIYASYEQKATPNNGPVTLVQANIDRAFRGAPRVSKNEADCGDYKIILLNGKNTEETGIVVKNGVRMTSLERTLIDGVVRPFYAGGVFEVLKAFEAAKQALSVNTIQAMLQKMNYIYPYKQALGFYLERAGYRKRQLNLLETDPFTHDFYLTYKMQTTEYSQRWRLHYPKGM